MGETGRTFQFAALKFLLEVGYASAFFAANALLVSRVGTGSLMPVYLAGSLLSIGLSSAFYFLIDRFPRRAVFSLSFLLLGAAVLLSAFMAMAWPQAAAVFWALRILFYAAFILIELEYWLAASLLFSNREAKRAFPWLVTSGIAGDVAGGMLAGFVAPVIGTPALPLIWGGIVAASAFFFLFQRFPKKAVPSVSTGILWGEIQAPSAGGRTRSPFANPLTVLLALFWVVYSFLCYGTDFVFNAYASKSILGEDALTAFFGRVTAIASAAVLAYQVFIAPRLGRRFGLDRVVLLMAALMAVATVHFFVRPSLAAVALAQGTVFFFIEQVATGNLNSALSVFPERIRGRIRVFTEGFGRPLGIVVLFLVSAAAAFKPRVETIAGAVAAVAAAFLAYPFLFRSAYARHLRNCLRSRDSGLVLNAVQAMGERGNEGAVDSLAGLLKDPEHVELRRAAVLSLAQIRGERAFKTVIEFLAQANDRDRADAVKALGKGGGREACPYLMESLNDADARVRANVIESLGLLGDSRALEGILPHLEDSNRRVRLNAAVAVCHLGAKDGHRERALKVVDDLYHSTAAEDRRAAVFAVGQLKLKSYEASLEGLLAGEDVRLAAFAAAALARLGSAVGVGRFAEFLAGEHGEASFEALRLFEHLPMDRRRAVLDSVERFPEEKRTKTLRSLDILPGGL